MMGQISHQIYVYQLLDLKADIVNLYRITILLRLCLSSPCIVLTPPVVEIVVCLLILYLVFHEAPSQVKSLSQTIGFVYKGFLIRPACNVSQSVRFQPIIARFTKSSFFITLISWIFSKKLHYLIYLLTPIARARSVNQFSEILVLKPNVIL